MGSAKGASVMKWVTKKRREDEAVVDVKQFELDRIVNLVKSFGWTVVSSSFEGDKVTVKLEKRVVAEVKT